MGLPKFGIPPQNPQKCKCLKIGECTMNPWTCGVPHIQTKPQFIYVPIYIPSISHYVYPLVN